MRGEAAAAIAAAPVISFLQNPSSLQVTVDAMKKQVELVLSTMGQQCKTDQRALREPEGGSRLHSQEDGPMQLEKLDKVAAKIPMLETAPLCQFWHRGTVPKSPFGTGGLWTVPSPLLLKGDCEVQDLNSRP